MRYLLLILSFFLFTACSSDDDEKADKYDFPTLVVDGENLTKTVNKAGRYDLKVISSESTITVSNHNDIRRLEINGSDNVLIFEGPMGDLDGALVTGFDNLACVPTEDDKFSFNIETNTTNKVIVIDTVEDCVHPDEAPSS